MPSQPACNPSRDDASEPPRRRPPSRAYASEPRFALGLRIIDPPQCEGATSTFFAFPIDFSYSGGGKTLR